MYQNIWKYILGAKLMTLLLLTTEIHFQPTHSWLLFQPLLGHWWNPSQMRGSNGLLQSDKNVSENVYDQLKGQVEKIGVAMIHVKKEKF